MVLIRRFCFYVITALLAGCSGGDDNNGSSDPATGNPLLSYQWYLFNNQSEESNAFTNYSAGNAGNHINALEAQKLATGKGITVNVVDSGLQLDHEDLTTNQELSYDYLEGDNNPQPSGNGGDHGTSVAGIIGMIDNNGVGGVGVAPGVTLIGHAFLKGNLLFADLAKSLGVVEKDESTVASEIAQVYNMSLGLNLESYTDSEDNEVQFTWDIYSAGITKGRKGKGYIYVKAVGNGFLAADSDNELYTCSQQPLGCQNSSIDYSQVHPALINVSATSAIGKATSYSTVGSALWIAAPGGEFGRDSKLWSLTNDDYSFVFHPAMITTDVQGCSKGYSKYASKPFNRFEYNISGPHGLNKNCNYTSVFNGTSSAAPVVSGVVALMLEVNPDLSWRDVKHILATTATRIDSSDTDSSKDSGVILENAWTVNDAGYQFHSRYGFGQVEAYKAVRAAKEYSGNLGTFTQVDITADGLTLAIPDYANEIPGHLSQTISVGDTTSIESIRLVLSVCADSSDIAAVDYTLHLTSPAGTVSVLKSSGDLVKNYEDDDSCAFKNAAFLTNAFYGESAEGNWTLDIYDLYTEDSGELQDYTLTIFGH